MSRRAAPRPAEASVLLRDVGDLFERGGELVRVTGDGVEPVSEDWLLSYLDVKAGFVRVRNHDEMVVADAPAWLARRLLSQRGDWGVPKLRAVISAPTMRADGTLLDKPGYDPATGLFLRPCSGQIVVPEAPTPDDLKAAAERLWRPFARFPFVDPTARSVMLAATLTAVVRQTLARAPAFAFDAPSAGTGKTLLASCLQALSGMRPQGIPECRGEEEMRKRLFAALRSGQPCILLDNIRGQFGSAALFGSAGIAVAVE